MDDQPRHDPGPVRHEDPLPETVAFGGERRSSRLSRWLQRRSPRQLSTMLVGSTALLGVVVLITVVGSDGATSESEGVERPQPIPDPDAAAAAVGPPANPDGDGRVWIGYNGVMVSVPRSWTDAQRRCEISETAPLHDWVRARCPAGSTPTSLLWLHQPNSFDGADDTTSITGMRIGEVRRVDGRFSQAVGLPSGDSVLDISSGSRKELIRLVGSTRPIPPSWVSIPDLVGDEPTASIRRIAELGLEPQVNHNSGTVLPSDSVVVDQNPRAGIVVKAGTRVSFSVLPSDSAG